MRLTCTVSRQNGSWQKKYYTERTAAKAFKRKYKVGKSYKCYYDPERPVDVAMRSDGGKWCRPRGSCSTDHPPPPSRPQPMSQPTDLTLCASSRVRPRRAEWQVFLGAAMLIVAIVPFAICLVYFSHSVGKDTREWVHSADGPISKLRSFFGRD